MNLLLTFRILKKNKLYSIINIAGLGVAIAAFLLLARYVYYQTHFDGFLPNAGQIYRVNFENHQQKQLIRSTSRTHGKLAQTMVEEIPGIKNTTKAYPEDVLVFNNVAKFSNQHVMWADSGFFRVFKLKMLKGSRNSCLTNTNTIVLSKSLATKLFGNQDPMGKTVFVNEHLLHIVTGVYEDLPENSHFKIDCVGSLMISQIYGWYFNHFDFPWLYTYVELDKNASPVNIEKGLAQISDKYLTKLKDANQTGTFKLQKLTELHYNTGLTGEVSVGIDKSMVLSLLAIAFIILVIGWVNFVNLFLAQSLERAGEIGIRKSFGAKTWYIIKQHLSEAIAIGIVTFAFGFVVQEFAGFVIRQLSSSTVFETSLSVQLWIFCATIVLLGTMFAGLYPAYKMSQLNPLSILKNKFAGKGKSRFRNLLLIIQFASSMLLLAATFIVWQQVSYMKNYDTGLSTSETLVIRGPASHNVDSLRQQRFFSLRTDFLQDPNVISGGATMDIPGKQIRFTDNNLKRINSQEDKKQTFSQAWIDDGYIQTFGLTLAAGRNFNPEVKNDLNNILLNQTAVKALGFASDLQAINQMVISGDKKYTIIGVIRDYHHQGLQAPIGPICYVPFHPFEFGYYSFRIKKGQLNSVIADLRNKWNKHYPNDPFDFSLLSDSYIQQYQNDETFGNILAGFSILAVFIACMGLFGMASLMIVKKTKEIGIRKVNGASLPNLIALLFKQFALMLLVAMVIALPIAYIVLQGWLNHYAYRITIQWWHLLLPALTICTITILTLIGHVWRTASQSPSKALRYE